MLPLKAIIAVPLSQIFTKAPVRLCNTPAVLTTPAVSVPAIQEAVVSTPTGWKRTRLVLRAALVAIPSGIARQMVGFITTCPAVRVRARP